MLLLIGCTETITIVHHDATADGDTYRVMVVMHASWHGKRGFTPSNNGFAPRDEYTVRIPAAFAPPILPQAGDLIVRGILHRFDGKRSLEGKTWFQASFVGDNRRNGVLAELMPHIVIKNT